MNGRAFIKPNLLMDGISITLVERREDGWANVYEFGPLSRRSVGPGQSDDPSKTLDLPDDVARALMESLQLHYGHLSAADKDLRRDYLAERTRVDKLTDALIARL